LQFLRENKDLWKRVELSSTNDTLSILLQINKSSKKLIKIGYVGFKKITYKDEQLDFYDFVEGITRHNGLYITSCNVCKSFVSIQLLLKYKNKQKNISVIRRAHSYNKRWKKKNENKDKDNKKKEKEENSKNNEEYEKKEEENINININNEDMKQEKENKSEEEDQENLWPI